MSVQGFGIQNELKFHFLIYILIHDISYMDKGCSCWKAD